MSISDDYERIDPKVVQIDRDARQRTEIDTSDLELSVAKHGILNPIIITRQMRLVAGERRLTAALRLGHASVPIRYLEDMPLVEARVIELEENLRRKDLPWQDECRAVADLHNIYGDIALQENRDWTAKATADNLNLSPTWFARALRVAKDLDKPLIAKCPSMHQAFNLLSRQDNRALADIMNQLEEDSDGIFEESQQSQGQSKDQGPGEGEGEDPDQDQPSVDEEAPSKTPQQTSPSRGKANSSFPQTASGSAGIIRALGQEAILNQSFLDWAPTYSGPKFSFINCDFPYGINLFSGPQSGRAAQTYADGQDIYLSLIDCLCENLDRIMAPSGHLMFWLSADITIMASTLDRFRQKAPSLVFHKKPLIWHKSDNVGILADPKRAPRHTYEAALIASREDRLLVKAKADSYSGATQRTDHVSTKPEPMLRHFFEMFVDSGTRMLDPTCGSGSSLRAAESLGAELVLGLEIDPDICTNARIALKTFRSLRSASKTTKTPTQNSEPANAE